ncbi:hypothetical protein G5V57_26535 [Nordella sp. HKS 07]|uniref:hypothetical protein n=1 Tax=Nordella sp. HKS 07 TaxID=2712222 RepID=UPI0013E16EEA|nr:hypothetical protein [Nordella sp. HKS 07]QIG50974.1 hypothetical protein G5V57_26535 [Nordella sp. HKS 07]
MSNERPYTGPMGIALIAKELHVEGYPDAVMIGKLNSKVSRRLAVLRLHQSALMTAHALIARLRAHPFEDSELAHGILVGTVATYFSCFGKNNAVFTLAPDRIFAKRSDIKEVFHYWKDIRDRHLIHNESEMTQMRTGVVLGNGGRVIDILSFQVSARIALDQEHQQSLQDLISFTMKRLLEEIDGLIPRVFQEVELMNPEQRMRLPSMQVSGFPTDKASRIRAEDI